MFANIYKNKKVLVTGHTGFKGSWLTAWLLKMGAKVCGLSDQIPTNPSMFVELGLDQKIEHHFCDIRDFEGVSKILTIVRDMGTRRAGRVKRVINNVKNNLTPRFIKTQVTGKSSRQKKDPRKNSRRRRSLIMDLNNVDILKNRKTEQILHINLPIVGISLVNNILSTRREELLYLSLNSLHLYTLERDMQFHVSLFVDVIQADNQMSTSTYPITLSQREMDHHQGSVNDEDGEDGAYHCEKCALLCQSEEYFKWHKDRKKSQSSNSINREPALHVCFEKDLSHVDIEYFDHIVLYLSPIDLTLDTSLVQEILTVYDIFDKKHKNNACQK